MFHADHMAYQMTASLSARVGGGGRALNFVYTQMLFALAFDRIVFGTQPGWMSAVGGALILGSAVWVTVRKENGGVKKEARNEAGDEEIALMDGNEYNETR